MQVAPKVPYNSATIFRLVRQCWWLQNCEFLEPGQFSERKWSPIWYSFLLKEAGVPNLTLLSLDQRVKSITRHLKVFVLPLRIWKKFQSGGNWRGLFSFIASVCESLTNCRWLQRKRRNPSLSVFFLCKILANHFLSVSAGCFQTVRETAKAGFEPATSR